MAKFEVFIPAADAGGFDTTLKVDAANWMAALKAGLQRLGEQGASIQNVLVDIQDDNSIHVTEPKDGRVFRIRELTEEEAAKAPVKRPSQIRAQQQQQQQPKTDPAVPAVAPPDTSKTVIQTRPAELEEKTETQTAHKPAPSKPPATQRPNNKSSPRIDVSQLRIDELQKPTTPVKGKIGRPKTQPGLKSSPSNLGGPQVNVEDILAEIFERVQDLQSKASADDALAFVLDLALEKVPADSGSVFRADYATGDLTFAVARGPKAKELLSAKIVVPAGNGIAGFCSQEGVSLAISDVDKDPRHYRAVADKVDYEITSIACAPMMTHGRSFGCVQLINKKGSHSFADHEIGIISYLAHQAALYLNTRAPGAEKGEHAMRGGTEHRAERTRPAMHRAAHASVAVALLFVACSLPEGGIKLSYRDVPGAKAVVEKRLRKLMLRSVHVVSEGDTLAVYVPSANRIDDVKQSLALPGAFEVSFVVEGNAALEDAADAGVTLEHESISGPSSYLHAATREALFEVTKSATLPSGRLLISKDGTGFRTWVLDEQPVLRGDHVIDAADSVSPEGSARGRHHARRRREAGARRRSDGRGHQSPLCDHPRWAGDERSGGAGPHRWRSRPHLARLRRPADRRPRARLGPQVRRAVTASDSRKRRTLRAAKVVTAGNSGFGLSDNVVKSIAGTVHHESRLEISHVALSRWHRDQGEREPNAPRPRPAIGSGAVPAGDGRRHRRPLGRSSKPRVHGQGKGERRVSARCGPWRPL